MALVADRDLSGRGALRIEQRRLCAENRSTGGVTLDTGEETIELSGEVVVPARVAWTGSGRVGLEFLSLIEEEELFVRPKPPSVLDAKTSRRAEFNQKLTEQDLKRAELWGATVGLKINSRNF